MERGEKPKVEQTVWLMKGEYLWWRAEEEVQEKSSGCSKEHDGKPIPVLAIVSSPIDAIPSKEEAPAPHDSRRTQRAAMRRGEGDGERASEATRDVDVDVSAVDAR